MRILRAGGLALLVLAGCKDEKKEAAPVGAPLAAVRSAALQSLATLPNMPKTVQFRGVQVYAQAAPRRTAICGLVSAFADDANIFVPFVTVATQVSPPEAATPRYEFDHRVGTTTTEATRVYGALVANCWDKGGPAPERPLALPPLPDNVTDPHAPGGAPGGAPGSGPGATPRAGASPAATGTATVRQSANVHAGPGGPSIRTVAQGTTLHIFSQAGGGWYQVGDTAPFGWVHESMLNR